MGVFDWFRKERGLEDLTLDEVRQEEARLGIREKQAVARIDEIDARKREVFGEGAKTKSPWRRRQLARRFQTAAFELRVAHADFARVSKELVTLQAIHHAVERRESDREGRLSMLNLLKSTELSKLMEDDRIGYEVYLKRVNDALSAAEGEPVDIEKEVGREGSELLDIWSRMDAAEEPDLDAALKEAEKSVTKRIVKEKELE